MGTDKELKEKLDGLVASTPDVEAAAKIEIARELDCLIRTSKKKSPFKSAKDRIEQLMSLIQKIACLDYSKTEITKFRTTFKGAFKLPVKDFELAYAEKRSAVLRESNMTKMKQEVEAVDQKLTNKKTSLLEIHAILADVSSASHDMIELVVAVAISLQISEKYGLALLWMLLVGPPSSDKTGSASTIRDVPFIYHLDTLTENSFISGFVSPDGSATQDLLAELHHKCFVVKDFTTLFSLKADTIRKILGDMCAIYDKIFAKFTGTRGRVQYEAAFSHLGCITPLALAGHHNYMNIIGPRYLFYRILPLDPSQLQEGYDIAWSGNERKIKMQQLKELVSAYVWQVAKSIPDLKPETAEQRLMINKLAELLRHGRGAIRSELVFSEKEGKTFSYYQIAEVQIEEPWRALQQIQVLARSLAVIHKRDHITDHELELVRRVVVSSMPVDRAEVLSLFQREDIKKQGGTLSRSMCADLINKGYTQAQRILTELKAVGLLEESKEDDNKYIYRPASKFKDLVIRPVNDLDHVTDLMGN